MTNSAHVNVEIPLYKLRFLNPRYEITPKTPPVPIRIIQRIILQTQLNRGISHKYH